MDGVAGRSRVGGLVLAHAPLFLFVAALVSFYGQLDRKQSADTYATVYTAAAIVRDGTVQLDRFLPIIQIRSGERPGQLETGRDGHLYSHFPIAPALTALPEVGLLAAAGVPPGDWDAHMEAGFFAGALVTAIAVALLYVLLTRLTTRPRALLVAAVFAWCTPTWTITGQGLWQHGGAVLALVGALLAVVERRWVPAGFALATMVAFRPSTLVAAALLAPLVLRGLRPAAWAALGAIPPAIAVLTYNRAAFGCATCTGYSDDLAGAGGFTGSLWQGLSGNLVAPGRGIFVYAPVLLFAVAGAVLGRRIPLYRWAALALAAHVLFVARWFEWWGGEAFGPRQLVDVLPLFALLLVPALQRWPDSRTFRWSFTLLAAWSFAVHFLGAALWPGTRWYDTHAVREFATWWNPLDSELTAFFSDPQRLALRGFVMAGIVTAAVVFGLAAARLAEAVPRPALRLRQASSGARSVPLFALSLLPYAAAAASAPWLLARDAETAEPFGGFSLALAAGALAVALARGAPTLSGLPAGLLVLSGATGWTGWGVLFGAAALAVVALERARFERDVVEPSAGRYALARLRG